MRGAFYVTTALLITNSIQAAAEANRSEYRQASYHDGVVPGSMGTKASPRRFLQGSHEPHDNLAVTAAKEERMPEPSTKITASLSEKALDTVKKATRYRFDLNIPPEKTSTGASKAHHILRDQNPRTYTASNLDVSRSPLSSKRTAQALTSPGKASGSANPKKMSDKQSKKKMRTSASLEDTEVQSVISRDKITSARLSLSNDDVQFVHSLYLQHLIDDSAVFKPTEDETRKMLGMIKEKYNWVPSSDQTYTRYREELMQMELQSLKKLGLDSNTVLDPRLRILLELSSKNLEKIQLCLLRLLCLRRWMHMYRDFFKFCHFNQKISGKFNAASRLQVARQMKDKFAESSVEVAPYFAALGTKVTRNTKVEIEMFTEVEAAVINANLKWADKQIVYRILDYVSRDENQLAASGHFSPIAEIFNIRTDKDRFAVFKTPPSFGPNEESLPGGQGKGPRDRNQIFELVNEATNRAKETTMRYKNAFVKRNEQGKFLQILDTFKKDSKPKFAPTLEMMKKMWRMFNWKEDSSDPRKFKYAGHSFLNYVCRLGKIELETVLGTKRETSMIPTQHMEEGDNLYLVELRTEYLMKLLETYDKFYPFCVRHRFLCEKKSLALNPKPSQ